MAVLAALAVCGDRGCTRERLLALLWPESDEAHARHGLRDALHAIRHTLTPASIPSTASLLHLDPATVGSDVVEFTEALASGRLADAARAYGGPLLDGFHLDDAQEFEHWLAGERARLARECAEGLEALATSAESAGNWAQAVGWWGRAVEHDPMNSHFVLHQMRAMSAIGDRANAVQAGEQHVRQLREEFGLEPDPTVQAMIGRIRRGELPAPPNGASRLLPVDRRPVPAHAGGPRRSRPGGATRRRPKTASRESGPRASTALAGLDRRARGHDGGRGGNPGGPTAPDR
jgi:DNA-binding SARP family transcriptional activator